MEYKTIDAIRRRDYIILDGEELTVKRVTSKEAAEKYSKVTTVYVVKDDEEGFLGAVDASVAVTKRDLLQLQRMDILIASGLDEATARKVVEQL